MSINKIINIFPFLFYVITIIYCLYSGYPFLIWLLTTPIICIISHELGHLIFGLISGYKFVSLEISVFRIYKVDNKMKFLFSPTSLFNGYCVMVPPNEKSQPALYLLG